jgi:hypothetical protein
LQSLVSQLFWRQEVFWLQTDNLRQPFNPTQIANPMQTVGIAAPNEFDSGNGELFNNPRVIAKHFIRRLVRKPPPEGVVQLKRLVPFPKSGSDFPNG